MWNMSPWSPHDTSISSYLICIPSACSMHCVCSPRPLSHLSVSMLTPGLVRTLECRLHTLRTTFRICVVTASTQGGTTLTQTIKIWACQWARNGDFTGEQNFEDLWASSRLLSATPSRQTRASSSCHVRTSDCQIHTSLLRCETRAREQYTQDNSQRTKEMATRKEWMWSFNSITLTCYDKLVW